jgi:CO dehydrogenase nickel-insertion accessory protein CooC1
VVVNKVEVDGDLQTAKRELDGNAQQIMSVSYDREVVEADKKGALLLDYSPQFSSLQDIMKVKQFMLSVE